MYPMYVLWALVSPRCMRAREQGSVGKTTQMGRQIGRKENTSFGEEEGERRVLDPADGYYVVDDETGRVVTLKAINTHVAAKMRVPAKITHALPYTTLSSALVPVLLLLLEEPLLLEITDAIDDNGKKKQLL
jgi:hypothetical protein